VVREHRDRRRAEEKVAEQAEEERQAVARANQQREAALDRERLKERDQRLESERVRLLESERAGRRFKRLSALLAVACIVAVAFVVATIHYRRQAESLAREETAVRLAGDSQLMLGGLSPDGSNDITAIQKALAAHALETNKKEVEYGLGAVLNQERDLQKIIDTPAGVTSVAFSPDRRQIAVAGNDNSIQLCNIDGQRIGATLTGHEGRVTAVAFSPDGTRIATASIDNTARLWDAATQQQIGQPLGHNADVLSVAFSPDGTRIATASADNRVRLWDAATQRSVGQPMTQANLVNGLAFSPDGTRIATAGADNTVGLWDVHNQQRVRDPLRSTDVVLHSTDVVMSVAFSPDGTRIAAGSQDTTIRVWDANSGSLVGVLSGHEAPVTAVAFNKDDTHLLSSGTDGTIRLWDTRWQPMIGRGGVAWARFFDDGRRIGSVEVDKGDAGTTVRWWDTSTGLPIGNPVHIVDSAINKLYLVDERRALSFGSAVTAQLWDARPACRWASHYLFRPTRDGSSSRTTQPIPGSPPQSNRGK